MHERRGRVTTWSASNHSCITRTNRVYHDIVGSNMCENTCFASQNTIKCNTKNYKHHEIHRFSCSGSVFTCVLARVCCVQRRSNVVRQPVACQVRHSNNLLTCYHQCFVVRGESHRILFDMHACLRHRGASTCCHVYCFCEA